MRTSGVRARRGRSGSAEPDQTERSVRRLPTSPGASLNHVGHQRRLSDPSFDAGVAPNADTLYSVAWLDLADEPFVLETPVFGSCYYPFQLACGDGSTELSLGTRTHGSELSPVFVSRQGNDAATPDGMVTVSLKPHAVAPDAAAVRSAGRGS